MMSDSELMFEAQYWAKDHFPMSFYVIDDEEELQIENAIKDGYISGYKECQSTIHSECIGFAEWIISSDFIHGCAPDVAWYTAYGEGLAANTEELYNIYQEQLKNK